MLSQKKPHFTAYCDHRLQMSADNLINKMAIVYINGICCHFWETKLNLLILMNVLITPSLKSCMFLVLQK